jgi:hypothetical protein
MASCPGKADQAVGADRLDVPRCRAEVMAVGAPEKATPSLAAPLPARRRGIEVSSVSIHSL